MPLTPIRDIVTSVLDDVRSPWTLRVELIELLIDAEVTSSPRVVDEILMMLAYEGAIVERTGPFGEREIASCATLARAKAFRDLVFTL